MYWQRMRAVIKEELRELKNKSTDTTYETRGMTFKPLYKIAEVCTMFNITKPTIYDWIKHGKLKPIKIRSRVYFLSQDVENLIRYAADENV